MTRKQLAAIVRGIMPVVGARIAAAALRLETKALDIATNEHAALRERVAVLEARAPIPGPAGASGRDGKDGADGLGFDDFSAEFDGDRTLTLALSHGDRRKAIPIELPIPKFIGPHQVGQTYKPGHEVVKHNGTRWVVTSTEATDSTPGESKAWTMSSRGPK